MSNKLVWGKISVIINAKKHKRFLCRETLKEEIVTHIAWSLFE